MSSHIFHKRATRKCMHSTHVLGFRVKIVCVYTLTQIERHTHITRTRLIDRQTDETYVVKRCKTDRRNMHIDNQKDT